MSLVRLLLYSNEFDLEALSPPLPPGKRKPFTRRPCGRSFVPMARCGRIYFCMRKVADAPMSWQARVFAGQPAYGMKATGPTRAPTAPKRSFGPSIARTRRPLWICFWGGANTLAQALLIELRATRAAADATKFVAKLRVYSISDQDDAGPWIRREFPELFYIVQPSAPDGGEYYYATWTGISGDIYYRNGAGADTSTVTNEWLETNIRSKGPLGKVYPQFMFIMEGDTPSFLGLIDNGLNAFRRPDWGGWGGRYVYRQPYGETHPIWTQGGDLFSRITSQDTVLALTAEYIPQTKPPSGVGGMPSRTTSRRAWIGLSPTMPTPTTIRLLR